MPLVAHCGLPAFARLRAEGEDVLEAGRARHQDIRELHLGLLNVMPDAAFEATERQFLRLVGSCNRIAQLYVHPMSIGGIERGAATEAHIAAHYRPARQVIAEGLDALIVTGANVPTGRCDQAPFWPELCEAFQAAAVKVTSTLCACLATHVALQLFHGLERRPLAAKRWGVFGHRPRRGGQVGGALHPLVRNINTRFDVPHSRHNDVPGDAMEAAGVRVLADSPDAGVHLAVSADLLRFVFFQGHPEYDTGSLFKEYKREVGRALRGERSDYPPTPDHYFDAAAEAEAAAFRDRALAGRAGLNELPEAELLRGVDNTWGDSARSVVANWLGCVYQVTGFGRDQPFMPGVDPEDPLRLRAGFG